MKTILTNNNEKFLINNSLVYSELENCPESYYGMLMNARFIQGVFDDKQDVSRFNRFGKTFDPQKNTDELCDSLEIWYKKGLRAITVGFQGGGPCFTTNNYTIINSPYSEDGLTIDSDYLSRMKQIITKADEVGMVVIVSLFYGTQSRLLKDDFAVMSAVKTVSNWLRDNEFTNVIIEIANEYNVGDFMCHPVLYSPKGIVTLIEIAHRESGNMLVGCSGMGGHFNEDIVKASSAIIIHGNNTTKQKFYELIQKCKIAKPNTPIICNEDSQAISQLEVAFKEGVSWGYYNNFTKQEPPTYWEITKGEDEFFAKRLAIYLGIEKDDLNFEDKFYIQGLEKHTSLDGKRWLKLASLYPELINYVEFYKNNELFYTGYADPFSVNSSSTWKQSETNGLKKGDIIKAKIVFLDGKVLEKTSVVESD